MATSTRKNALWIVNAEQPIRAGLSGSPILGADGKAIGIVCASQGTDDPETRAKGGPNAGYGNLPGWLPDELPEASATFPVG